MPKITKKEPNKKQAKDVNKQVTEQNIKKKKLNLSRNQYMQIIIIMRYFTHFTLVNS